MSEDLALHPDLQPKILDDENLIGRNGRRYHADRGLLAAANVALTLGRPLLLTGEPGCGKTDFAWATARSLGRQLQHDGSEHTPLQCYIRSDTQARDLLYRYDAVRRFGDAHHGGEAGAARAQDSRHYIELQPLGIALASAQRRVVLIDEIDKAPRDLPNDLLRELDASTFEIPEIPGDNLPAAPVLHRGIALRRSMVRPIVDGQLAPPPLILITSNIERQLPDAFLRRCIFWHIPFPEHLLLDILSDHFPEQHLDFLSRSVAVFLRLRKINGLIKRPATAELIDWVGAMTRVFDQRAVTAQIRKVSDTLDAMKWTEVPALACLVKLREDKDTLCRA